VFDQLDDGGVELALNTLTEGGDRFKCSGLLDDDYVAILSADNPASIEPALSIERFAACPISLSAPASRICVSSTKPWPVAA
jgi:hypothetical protein